MNQPRTTRPKWSARAFINRVRISPGDTLFVLVEGRSGDRPFYDRIINTRLQLQDGDYFIQPVEEISVDDTSAGGKAFAYALFDYFDSVAALVQQNSVGRPRMVFMLDRDLDDYGQEHRRHDHLVHTATSDVESEILLNGDLVRATSSSYGITLSQARQVLGSDDLASNLGRLYRDWLIIGIFAKLSGYRGPGRFRNRSEVNRNQFGPVDRDSFDSLMMAIAASLLPGDAGRLRAESIATVDGLLDAGNIGVLLKGRWIAAYVAHLVKSAFEHSPLKTIPPEHLVDPCLETLDFTAVWTDYYEARLRQVLAA